MTERVYTATIDILLKDNTISTIPLRTFDSDNDAARWQLSDEYERIVDVLRIQYWGLLKEMCHYTNRSDD